MKNSLLTVFTFAVVSIGAIGTESASGQNAILAEMYGRGVHAYYAGLSDEANQFLTMAIDNGIQDPRAYYFRGMVAEKAGQPDQAASDWTTGAEMEASGRTNPSIGRSLARFQGSARLKLERIRQSARLQAMATSMARSKQRYGEIQASEANVARSAPAGSAPPATVTPPPIPPSAENPFADDMAQGKPNVQADDALKDAMNDPFADDGVPAVSAGNSNPFGGGGDAGADPFGGGGGADPFGGGGDAGAADPFGGAGDAGADPFGGGGDAGADPFGT
jgi:hypothetical protein